MKYKKLYVTKTSSGRITGVFTTLQKIVETFHERGLNVLELEQIDFDEENEMDFGNDLIISLIEVNPIFD